MSLALKLALSPLLVWQAVRTRQRIPRLPEPEGPRRGVAGQGRLLRLLVAGDSSAAGVGVALQQHALAAPLAQKLAERTGLRIEWQLLARAGLSTAQTLQLMRRECVRADIAVIVTGVNDVVEQVPSQRAVREREALATWLLHHGGARHVAFLPLPPVHRFHGLPQPLRWVAGADARRHNRRLRDWAQTPGDAVSLVDVDVPMNRGMMASDGFHPGEKAYRYIAQAVAVHLAQILSEGGAPAVMPSAGDSPARPFRVGGSARAAAAPARQARGRS
jgi:lysophospholipase L1-like esterase